MPTELPPFCPQCGRRPQDCTTTVQAEWRAQEETLCPLCTRNWAKVGPAPVEGRCAGCGAKKKATALKEGVCARCRRTGVSAPSLFDEPEPTVDQLVTDYLDRAMGLTVTPALHAPGDDPHA